MAAAPRPGTRPTAAGSAAAASSTSGRSSSRSFDWFGLEGWHDLAAWDVREIDQSGVDEGRQAAPLALERPGGLGGGVWLSTDASARSRWRRAPAAAGPSRDGAPAARYWWVSGKLALRPHPRVETRLEVLCERNAWQSRYVTDDGAPSPREREYLLGDLAAPDLSVTLRQQLVLTPRLTLQAYAQLFTTHGRYASFRIATPRGGKIRLRDLQPTAAPDQLGYWDNPDFREGTLAVNVVLRWEYRLGSTLFLVYSRSQAELGYPDDALDPSPPATLRPWRLGPGATDDTFLVKWSYWWSR